ncbi:hypothetical protein GCM10009612_62020 [Streptomyces beijiangensis]
MSSLKDVASEASGLFAVTGLQPAVSLSLLTSAMTAVCAADSLLAGTAVLATVCLGEGVVLGVVLFVPVAGALDGFAGGVVVFDATGEGVVDGAWARVAPELGEADAVDDGVADSPPWVCRSGTPSARTRSPVGLPPPTV